MNNISSLTEQTITLVPSAEFCIPVLSFVLCLLHCTVPGLSLSPGRFVPFLSSPYQGIRGDGRRRVNIFFTETLSLIRPRIDKSENMVHNVSMHQKSNIFCFGCVAFWPLHSLHGDGGGIFLQYEWIWNYVSTCSNSSLSCWGSSGNFYHQGFDRTLYLCLHSIAATIFIVIWEIDYKRNIRHRGSDQSYHGPRRSLLRLLPISLQFHIRELIFPILGPILALSQQKNSANIGCCTFTHFDNAFVGETSPIAIRVISSTNQLALGYI